MAGPWRDRTFDPSSWHPPAPHVELPGDPAGPGPGHDRVTGFVIGYVAAVVTSVALMLGLMKFGGW